jgi:hypothetical protein
MARAVVQDYSNAQVVVLPNDEPEKSRIEDPTNQEGTVRAFG